MILEMFGLAATQFSVEFVKGMIKRVVVGQKRYGGWQAARDKIDFARCAKDRIKQYESTGNTEFLIDAANFCMGEFIAPGPGAHFSPVGDSEPSPGLISLDGNRVRHPDDVRD